jgi:preprotein translocase subunit SecB
MAKGPVIYLDGYNINEIKYNTKEKSKSVVSTGEPEFSFTFGFTEDLKNAQVTMNVDFFEEKNERRIFVSISGNFTIPETDYSTEEIQVFVAQNGSAMLYPYLRSIVSVITTLDGPSAVVLPTLNMIDELSKFAQEDHSES